MGIEAPDNSLIGRLRSDTATRGRAFSLLEMLVVMSVIGLMTAILLPAFSASRRLGLKVKCIAQMQKTGFEFRMFADDFAVRTRGNSDQLGPNAFFIEDFGDKMYRTGEFMTDVTTVPAPYDNTHELMMCPAGPKMLLRRRMMTSFEQTVWPPRNVSLAINRRLLRDGKRPGVKIVTSRILDYPNVPIIIDVGGAEAVSARKSPFYIAPPTNQDDSYRDGRYWFPSYRHGRTLNVAFVDGHVASSSKPLEEPSWRWSYSPK